MAGRAIWRVYAENLGVVPDPVVDPWEIVVFGLSTLVLALLVGTAAAHRQARTRPGTFLRSE